MIKIKMYKANEGDAFLVSFNNYDINILIDMGLESTYQNSIKKDLLKLKSKGKKIDLLIITHIDNDHVTGAVNFIKENGVGRSIIDVDEIWHNSYRHLQFNKLKEKISKEETSALETIKKQNKQFSKNDGLSDIGVEEGVTLASLLYQYKYNWNTSFNNNAVSTENGNEINLKGIKFILLSPNRLKLERLAKVWLAKLESIFYDFKISDDKIFDDAFELFMQNQSDNDIAEFNDISSTEVFNLYELAKIEEKENSATNGSSIAFIMEHDEKKLLFLADAHENIIYENLKNLKDNHYNMNFEAVKISHHGSNKNISKRLLQLFDSKRFLISSDGKKNNHPDLESIAKIVLKESKNKKELYFNYDNIRLNFFKDPSLKKVHKYNMKFSCNITIN